MLSKYKRFIIISLRKIIRQVNISSHSIAMGFAVGIFVAFTPLVGLQLLITIGICIWLKYNKITGTIAVFVSNPFTFLPIYLFNFYVGKWLFEDYFGSDSSAKQIINLLENPSLKAIAETGFATISTFFLGCIIVGLLVAIISYFSVRSLVDYYRQKKARKKLTNQKISHLPKEFHRRKKLKKN